MLGGKENMEQHESNEAEKRASGSLQRVVMPRTPAEWSAYRCQLSCKIGRDALDGKTQPPAGCSPLEYAVFNLLHAVEELSRYNAPGERPATGDTR
jgi:hypothetical protein